MIAELLNVSRAYQSSPEAPPQRVLDGVDLTLTEGETVAVTGPSGCGKSTLLNILGTLDKADGGTVKLFGEDLAGADEDRLSALRAERIGFIFQLHHLLPQCTALENVLVPALAGPGKPDMAAMTARAKELLDRVGLAAHMNKKPAQLSGGERQRTAVARALIRKPALVLADEPTGALDAASAAALMDLLLEINAEQGMTLVLVTHDPALAARMGRRLRLEGGRLV